MSWTDLRGLTHTAPARLAVAVGGCRATFECQGARNHYAPTPPVTSKHSLQIQRPARRCCGCTPRVFSHLQRTLLWPPSFFRVGASKVPANKRITLPATHDAAWQWRLPPAQHEEQRQQQHQGRRQQTAAGSRGAAAAPHKSEATWRCPTATPPHRPWDPRSACSQQPGGSPGQQQRSQHGATAPPAP